MTRATVGIMSIGDMGGGFARFLRAHQFRVVTIQLTQDRARSANLNLLSSDEELVTQSHYLLSIVPPRDSYATAERISKALDCQKRRDAEGPLYFLDLNAISPSSSRRIGDLLAKHGEGIRYLDGGIIGGPPKLDEPSGEWKRPCVILSGPYALSEATVHGPLFLQMLNGKEVGSDIGKASGLKCCFSSLSKGFISLAIRSFSTASQLGVLPDMLGQLSRYHPTLKEIAERGVVSMAPKAYRFVDEMHEIGKTLREDGGWRKGRGDGGFDSMADVYQFVANDTVLGEEKIESRKRKTVMTL